jgi:mono/diheme cytochrome c family protein
MKKFILIAIIFFVAGCAGDDKKATPDETTTETNINGEILFKANCASCHKPDKDFTGPPLKGALQRWGGDKKAMYAFIRNPMKSVQENAYAKNLYEKYLAQMTAFSALSDAEINAIMNYCENYKATQ